MKINIRNGVSILLAYFMANGCSSGAGTTKGFDQLSISEIQLNRFTDSLKSIYYSRSSDSEKNKTTDRWPEIFNNYLSHHRLDSIHVHVDEVKIVGRTITTTFHCKDIQFKYGMRFLDSLSSRDDSLFEFEKDLHAGSDRTVSFSYMGSCQINNPEDKSLHTFRIFAFPVPLDAGKR
jgi:hypothetical protein